MRNYTFRLLPTALLVVGCCLAATGCQSMKSGFSKVAFWKKDTPPTSELAQRNREIAPPSRSASVLEGTTTGRNIASGSLAENHDGDRFAKAQNDTSQGSSPSAYGRTEPYTYQPTKPETQVPNDRSKAGGLGSVVSSPGKRAFEPAGDSGNFGGNQFGSPAFGTKPSTTPPPSSLSNSSPSSVNSPYIAKAAEAIPKYGELGNSGASNSTATNPIPRQPIDRGPAAAALASNNTAGSREYPSTKFGSYSPAASRAGLETDANQSAYSNISQVSSNESFGTSATANTNNNLAGSVNRQQPIVPAALLKHNGSYAPGSIGSSGQGYPGGFSPGKSSIASQTSGCKTGCSCSSCKSASTADAGAASNFSGGGSFNLR